MRTIVNVKRQQICLLLCFLLIGQFYNYGIFSSDPLSSSGTNGFIADCSNGVSRHSSIGDVVYAGLDFMRALNDGARLSIASAGKSRGQNLKNNYSLSAVISASHVAGLINYLRLSQEIYTQFDFLRITTFLHKKDGTK